MVAVTLRQIEAKSYQHAVSDRRKPSRYEVLVDGVVVGEVATCSSESWDRSPNGRIHTRMRGYTRGWSGDIDGRRVVAWAYSRRRAVEQLVEHYQAGR